MESRLRGLGICVVAVSVLVASCQSVGPPPQLPPEEPPASREKAQRLYDELKVTKVQGGYQQGSRGEVYPTGRMSELFESDGAEASASYRTGSAVTIVGTMVGLGAFAVLTGALMIRLFGEIGNGLVVTGTDEEAPGIEKLRTDTNATMGISAAVSVVGLLLLWSANMPYKRAAEQFDADLQAKLGLK